MTPFLAAFRVRHLPVIVLLASDERVDANKADGKGVTALSQASSAHQLAVVTAIFKNSFVRSPHLLYEENTAVLFKKLGVDLSKLVNVPSLLPLPNPVKDETKQVLMHRAATYYAQAIYLMRGRYKEKSRSLLTPFWDIMRALPEDGLRQKIALHAVGLSDDSIPMPILNRALQREAAIVIRARMGVN